LGSRSNIDFSEATPAAARQNIAGTGKLPQSRQTPQGKYAEALKVATVARATTRLSRFRSKALLRGATDSEQYPIYPVVFAKSKQPTSWWPSLPVLPNFCGGARSCVIEGKHGKAMDFPYTPQWKGCGSAQVCR